MSFRKGSLRTVKVRSPKSGQLLGLKTVAVKASTVKPPFTIKAPKPK